MSSITMGDNQKSEKDWYSFWEKQGLFKADPDSKKPKYSLLIPPPNLTGELHLGHAMQHSILDAVARYKRMRGYDVLLLPGVDHAGIQFESTLEKKLAREGLSKQKLGREKWLEKAWEFKGEVYKSVSSTWRFLGLSADWSREVFTLDEGPRQAVFEEFKSYFDKGLIYKGPYIVQWCPKDQTAIEDVEVEYEERKEKLYYIRYPIAQHPRFRKSASEHIVIATARPETIFADVAIAVNPESQWKKFVGETAYHPDPLKPYGRQDYIEIIEDKRVDKNFGTGALKITPGHDPLDYQIGKDHKLPVYHVIDKTGRLTELAGNLKGLKVEEARTKAAELLEKGGFMEKVEEYVHSVPVCERCKTTVEPLISEEWFVKVGDMAKDAVKLIKSGKINFLPKNYADILTDWLANIHDWCISRSLWWGHRIPVWYLKEGKSAKESKSRSEVKVSLDSPGSGWFQDEQVLDTWFSSGLWPLSTLGWPNKTKEFEKYFPWDFEITAPEIKYLWIARMIMISNYFTSDVPFKTMFFHGMLRDLEGRKFSKSLGNGVEPTYLIGKWGVDATRMTLYSYAVPGRDGRVSKQLMDQRAKNYRNFATKLRNIAKFIFDLGPQNSFAPPSDANIDDKWIKDELSKTIKNVTKNFENLNLHLAADEIYDFVWHKFADVYLEKSKSRRNEVQAVLEYVLKESTKLLHPLMPFVTEEIYQKFDQKKASILLDNWPQ